MTTLTKIREAVSAWPDVSVHAHRFGGSEFRLGHAEVGHVHEGGTVDIPFPRAMRDALLAAGSAEEHHFVPDSGWVTFRMRGEEDVNHAIWLLRLSYLRYALRTGPNPLKMLQQEAATLQLSPPIAALLEKFAFPTTAKRASTAP